MVFEYRGVQYKRTNKGHWIFTDLPPHGGYWSRFFTEEDHMQILPDSHAPFLIQDNIMKRAIDRMHKKTPVYFGDIRDQYHGAKKGVAQ